MNRKRCLFFIAATLLWSATLLAERGEVVTPMIMGNMVHVNNKICASSHTVMAEQDIGKFTSRVTYEGPDPKYGKLKGKTLVFNQCCTDCIKRFKTQWKENPEAIMEFHGLK